MMGRVSFEVSLCGSNNSKKVGGRGGGGATPICTHNDWMTPGGCGWICTAVISGCGSCFLSFSCTFFLQCSGLCLSLVPSFAYLSSLLDFLHLSVFLPSIDLYSFISACRSLSMSLSCSVCPPFLSSFCSLHVFRGSFFRWFWIAFLLVFVAFALLCFGGIVPKHRPKLGRPCGLFFLGLVKPKGFLKWLNRNAGVVRDNHTHKQNELQHRFRSTSMTSPSEQGHSYSSYTFVIATAPVVLTPHQRWHYLSPKGS